MNETVFYVPLQALMGYLGTVTSEGIKLRMIVRVLSDIHQQNGNPRAHSPEGWCFIYLTTVTTTPEMLWMSILQPSINNS